MRAFIEEILISIPMLLQNVPSAMVAHVLLESDDLNDDHAYPSPSFPAGSQKPKVMVLDMCAAPGGKASHVAALAAMGSALVVACDKSRRKVVAMRELYKRLGVSHNTVPLVLNTTRCVIDSCNSTSEASKADNVVPLCTTIEAILANSKPSQVDGLLQVQGIPPASFDLIVLDPPCSALGLRPKLHINNDLEDLLASVRYQKKFVDAAIQLLKPGGILSYSTCTINSGENEGIVRYVLDQYGGCGGMELLPIVSDPTSPLALLGGPGLPHQGLDPAQCACVRRFDPANAIEDTMGFFIAKFRKKRHNNNQASNAVQSK
jgi:16S rRNA C967 or C1407 C5-methylase (RsmB/RsmF family)